MQVYYPAAYITSKGNMNIREDTIDLKINDAEAFVPHPLHSSVISNPNFPTADLLLS